MWVFFIITKTWFSECGDDSKCSDPDWLFSFPYGLGSGGGIAVISKTSLSGHLMFMTSLPSPNHCLNFAHVILFQNNKTFTSLWSIVIFQCPEQSYWHHVLQWFWQLAPCLPFQWCLAALIFTMTNNSYLAQSTWWICSAIFSLFNVGKATHLKGTCLDWMTTLDTHAPVIHQQFYPVKSALW